VRAAVRARAGPAGDVGAQGRSFAVLLIYRLICVFLAALIVAAILRRRPLGEQVTGALVLVPLLLRIFLVK